MTKPALVVVSGPAGSGKTTLAHAVAQAIPCPAICRDEIKEGMVHAIGGGFVPAPGDPLTKRTFSVFFDTVRLLLEARVTVVAEAAFQDNVWRPELEALDGLSRLRIIRCRVDPTTARQRVANRSGRSAHADASVLTNADYFDEWPPISLAEPTIDVATSEGYEPPLDRIIAFVNQR